MLVPKPRARIPIEGDYFKFDKIADKIPYPIIDKVIKFDKKKTHKNKKEPAEMELTTTKLVGTTKVRIKLSGTTTPAIPLTIPIRPTTPTPPIIIPSSLNPLKRPLDESEPISTEKDMLVDKLTLPPVQIITTPKIIIKEPKIDSVVTPVTKTPNSTEIRPKKIRFIVKGETVSEKTTSKSDINPSTTQ